jgi:hypothetical protein
MPRTMKAFIISFMGMLLVLLVSCTKDSSWNSNDSFELNQAIELRAEGGGKDERGCITADDKAGIECFSSVGNSCKKIHACKALSSSSINAEHFFTPAELNNWMNVDYRENRPFMIHMWEIGYFNHPDSIR